MPDVRSFDVRILATDINPHVLQTARRGVYSAEEAASVPLELRRAWMEPAGGGALRLDDAARGLITFRTLNLIGAWPMSGPFDAVFCRNVVIYFDEKTQMRLLNRMTVAHPPRRLSLSRPFRAPRRPGRGAVQGGRHDGLPQARGARTDEQDQGSRRR